jgi:hypothetical protein
VKCVWNTTFCLLQFRFAGAGWHARVFWHAVVCHQLGEWPHTAAWTSRPGWRVHELPAPSRYAVPSGWVCDGRWLESAAGMKKAVSTSGRARIAHASWCSRMSKLLQILCQQKAKRDTPGLRSLHAGACCAAMHRNLCTAPPQGPWASARSGSKTTPINMDWRHPRK